VKYAYGAPLTYFLPVVVACQGMVKFVFAEFLKLELGMFLLVALEPGFIETNREHGWIKLVKLV